PAQGVATTPGRCIDGCGHRSTLWGPQPPRPIPPATMPGLSFGRRSACDLAINYHPQSGWFEDAPLKGGAVMVCPRWGRCCRKPSGGGAVIALPPLGALCQEALSEGTVAGGPRRGLTDCLDPPRGWASRTSAARSPPTPVARRVALAPPDSGCTAGGRPPR